MRVSQITSGLQKNKVGAIGGAIAGWYLSGKIPLMPLFLRVGLALATSIVGAELQARETEGRIVEAQQK